MAVDLLYRAPKRVSVQRVVLVASFAGAAAVIFGRPVSRPLVEVAVAQADHEMADDASTPEDDDACWNYNFTGLKAEKGKPWTNLGTHEIVKNELADQLERDGLATKPKFPHKAPEGYRAVYFKNLGPELSHRATRFRAFDSAAEGAVASLLKYAPAEGDRPAGKFAKPKVLAALLAGDARAFALALKPIGYYTADAEEYATSVVSRLERARAAADQIDWDEFEATTFGEQLLARLDLPPRLRRSASLNRPGRPLRGGRSGLFCFLGPEDAAGGEPAGAEVDQLAALEGARHGGLERPRRLGFVAGEARRLGDQIVEAEAGDRQKQRSPLDEAVGVLGRVGGRRGAAGAQVRRRIRRADTGLLVLVAHRHHRFLGSVRSLGSSGSGVGSGTHLPGLPSHWLTHAPFDLGAGSAGAVTR
jgi:hypothetical protein